MKRQMNGNKEAISACAEQRQADGHVREHHSHNERRLCGRTGSPSRAPLHSQFNRAAQAGEHCAEYVFSASRVRYGCPCSVTLTRATHPIAIGSLGRYATPTPVRRPLIGLSMPTHRRSGRRLRPA